MFEMLDRLKVGQLEYIPALINAQVNSSASADNNANHVDSTTRLAPNMNQIPARSTIIDG